MLPFEPSRVSRWTIRRRNAWAEGDVFGAFADYIDWAPAEHPSDDIMTESPALPSSKTRRAPFAVSAAKRYSTTSA